MIRIKIGWKLACLALLTASVSALAQTPTVTAVVNLESYGIQICPGAIAAVYGTNFLPSATAVVSVTVGTTPAYIFNKGVAANLISIELPFGIAPGQNTLTVTVNGVSSMPYTINLSNYAPALVSANSTGSGPGAILNVATDALITLSAPAHPGDSLFTYATGLGQTNPPSPTGGPAAAALTAVTPTLTVGGVAAKSVEAVLPAGYPGLYQVNFIVPAGVQGTQPMILSIGGVSGNNQVSLPIVGLTSLVSNASFGSPGTAAPGSIVTVFANGLGSTDQITGFPSTKFQGAQVTFNGIAAPLFHLVASATQQQIDLLVPDELPTSGTVNVQLTTPTALYPNYTLTMAPAVVGLYRINDPVVTTRANVIAQFANTAWLALPASTTTALKLPACTTTTNALSTCGQPATIGDYLVLYLTGLGITTPNGDPNGKPLPTGTIPPVDGSVLYETPTLPAVTVGGIPVKVLYSGLAPGFPGEYQIDFQVPSGVTSGDDIPVVVTMLGSSDTATISVQPRP